MSNKVIKLPSAPKLLANSLHFYIANWRILLPITAVFTIADLSTLLFINKDPAIFFVSVVPSTIIWCISTIALVLAIVKRKEHGFVNTYSKSFRLIIPFIWISLLGTVIAMGGLPLLVIPGILLTLWLSLSSYALIAENLRGTKALVRSWQLIKGHTLSVFWRYLLINFAFIIFSILFSLIINIQAIIQTIALNQNIAIELLSAFFLGGPINQILSSLLNGFFFFPTGIIYTYLIYQSLKKIRPHPPGEIEERKIKKKIHIFMAIGVVFIIVLIALATFMAAILFPLLPLLKENPELFSTQSSPAPIIVEEDPEFQLDL